MDIIQLKYFQTVARGENFSRAAEILHVAQPALSVSISRLERELGVELFDRRGRKVYLNPCGAVFLQYADRALADFEQTIQHLQQIKHESQKIITIAVSSFMSIQPIVIAYKSLHRDIRINQYSVLASDLSADLKQGKCDFCVATHPICDPELDSVVFLKQKVGLIVPADSPFATREWVDLYEAKDEPFICMQKNTSFRRFTDELFNDAGFKPKVVMEYFQSQLLELVERKIGISIGVWYKSREPYFQNSLRFIPLRTPDRQREVSLHWRKSSAQEGHIQNFIRFAVEYYKDPENRP